MKKISRKKWLILAVLLAIFSIFIIPRFVFQPLAAKFHWGPKAAKIYYCPMHPTYHSDRPGDCPICYMKLVPKEVKESKKEHKILYYRHPMGQPDTSPVPKKDSMGMDYIPVYEDELTGSPSKVPGYATVEIPAERQQLIGVKLGTVEKKKLMKEIRTVGRVAYDPELYTAQQEFLSAVKSLERAEAGGPYHEPPERTRALVEAARTRLRLLGMSETEINDLEKNESQDRRLILPTANFPHLYPPPAKAGGGKEGGVWVYATIYEYEIPFVKAGSQIKIFVPTFPDKEFTGEVKALDPVLDSGTRSIRVRAQVANPEGLLKPEMYVDVYLTTDLGEALAIPEEAVMQTGERTIVFVAQGEGYFEPRDVKLGTKAGKF